MKKWLKVKGTSYLDYSDLKNHRNYFFIDMRFLKIILIYFFDYYIVTFYHKGVAT
jgi:hypothetical protein